MAHYDIFRHHLAIKYPAYGHALWEPSPGYSYPAVEIGDVGFIREGRFHRLFNILLPAEDPSHENYGVPEYHEQLTLRMRNHIIASALGPNNLCSARVTSQPVPRELAMGPDSPTEVVFSCGRKQGAILSLLIQAMCKNTVALGDFGEWMIKHIDSWFAWVRRLGVGIDKMEDIVLVTGTHRTRSWTNVAFPGGQVDGLVSFGANVATRDDMVTINWKFSHEYSRGAVMNYGPHGDDLPEDQCIFIRGYRVARKLIFLPRGLKAAAGPNPDPKGGDYEPDVELMSMQAVPEYRDPLHTILEYIIEEAPNCDMALVHDDDLARIDVLGDGTSPEDLEPDEVLGYLRSFAGKPKVHDIPLGADPFSSSSTSNADVETPIVATLSTVFEELALSPIFLSHDCVSESPHWHIGEFCLLQARLQVEASQEVPSSPTMSPTMFSGTSESSTPTLVRDQHSSGKGWLPPLPQIRAAQIREPSTSTLVLDQHSSRKGGLPPLPPIRSAQIREEIFTDSSSTARRRGEFEAPLFNSSQDNQVWTHLGDPVIGLAVTDLIQDLHPRLHVGPASKLRDRLKTRGILAELAVAYGLHEILRAGSSSLKESPNVQANVFKAYAGGLFREQGMDIVKQWLEPLFRPLVDTAYSAERRQYLVPWAAPVVLTVQPVRQRGPSPQAVNSARLDTSMILGKRRRDPSPETGKEAE